MYRGVIAIFLLIMQASCGSKPAPEQTVKKDSVVKPPKKKTDSIRSGLIYPGQLLVERKSAYDSFYGRIGDSVYSCTYKGRFESSDTAKTSSHFLFDIDAEYIIDKVYLHPMSDGRYFLFWQETDHVGVNTYSAVFKRGTNKPDWKIKYRAPSPSQPVISGDVAYICCRGTIAKVELTSGKKIWEHDSLFDPYKLTFKEFNRPLVYDHTACFYDLPIRGKKNRSDSIWVNDETGIIGK